MPEIRVSVRNKIAQALDDPEIVCGNSDYTVTFDFDAEWDAYEAKTARFVYLENGIPRRQDLIFTGNSVQIPAVYNTCELLIGVYAGDIRTTTAAEIPCLPCITDGQPYHPDPPDDVYAQLLELLEEIDKGGSGGDGGSVILPEIIGGTDIIRRSVIGTFEREDPESTIPRMAAPTMPTVDIYSTRQETSVTIEDEYYGDATAIAVLLYQNGAEITKPEGWTLVNDPEDAALTYTPAETPTNVFNATTWMNGGTGVSGLYYFQNCSGTKDTANGALTYTLDSLASGSAAYAYPYRVDPNDTGHPPYKIPVTAGLDYIFEADITSTGSIGRARVGFYGNGSTTNMLGNVNLYDTNGKLTCKFTVPSGVTFVTIIFQVYGPASRGTKVTISNISVKVDTKNQRLAVYKKHLTRSDKTSSFTFFAQNETNDTSYLEALLLVKSGNWDLTVLDSGVVNDVSYTPEPMANPNRPLLYVAAAPTWYGSQCAVQVSGGTSSTDDKLHTVDFMRLSATYDITHLPMQTEPTFTSDFPVTSGFNGTMQYYLLKLDPVDE